MLKQGVHPKIVQERLGHASIQITLDTYSHVAPGLQQAAFTLDTYGHVTPRMQRAVVDSLDRLVEKNGEKNGGKMVAKGSRLSVGRTGLEPVTP